TVTGALNSTPSTNFTLQFFANTTGASPSQTLLGTESVTTNSAGDATLSFTFPVITTADQFITSTATDPAGNTSDFFPQNGAVKLANLSTRGDAGVGDNVLIGGFIIQNGDTANLLIRALGPSLPLSGTLADPTLKLI